MSNRGINKVIIIGNLGQNPEVRYIPNGSAVTTLTVATSENWRDKQTGENKEHTEWHRIVIYGKLAEIAGEYLRKGSQVYIEGQLRTRKWQDQNGQDRYTTEIVVSLGGTMQMLGSKQNNSNIIDSKENNNMWNKTQRLDKNIINDNKNPEEKKDNKLSDDIIDFDDDIPF